MISIGKKFEGDPTNIKSDKYACLLEQSISLNQPHLDSGGVK